MSQVYITIDNKQILADTQNTILQTALEAGLYIPNLCDHPDLPPSGECGLCVVEIEGKDKPVISCTTKVSDGLIIRTDSENLRLKQRQILEKILSQHPTACLVCWRKERCKPFDECLRHVSVTERCVTCPENSHCELQRVSDFVELKCETIPYEFRNLPVNRDNPFFELDYNLCINCGRCVRACRDLRGIKALDHIEQNGYQVCGPFKNGDYKDSGCKFCFSCVEVCPTGALCDLPSRYRSVPDWEAYVVPCSNACPAHIDIPKYLYFASEGRYGDSLATVREKVPFPGVLGRVCIHPCEQACRRSGLNKDEPICIKFIKRFASDNDNGIWKQNSKIGPPTGKKVAVVGSGPAGLTAAFYLAKKGHSVTVFEALPKTGGMMRVGIPRYRLPDQVLDSEIKEIENVGVQIKTNSRIESIDALFKQGYNAIFVGIGAHKGTKGGLKGEDLPGVINGVDFLRQVNLGQEIRVGDKVGVVGGGNSAIDCARVALRIGAKKVTIFYRRTRAEMPASPEEIVEALHEGVEIQLLVAANEIRERSDGKIDFECVRMRLGEPDASGRPRPEPINGSNFVTELDNLISSIGQTCDIPQDFDLNTIRGNLIKVNNETMETSKKGIFAGGDIVTGPASVIGAIAHGRLAASSIDKYLGGNGIIDESLASKLEPNPVFGQDFDFIYRHQPKMPNISDRERLEGFTEVELGYEQKTGIDEAKRCLRCDMRLSISSTVKPPIKIKAR